MPFSVTEEFFIGQVNAGILRLTENGRVFNTKTRRYIGTYSSAGMLDICMLDIPANTIRHIHVHKLIWLLHRGEIPETHTVSFIDNNPHNRRLSNLELRKTNAGYQAARKLGKFGFSTEKRNTKLTAEIVAACRKEYAEDQTITSNILAARYSVGRTTMLWALTGRTWKHLTTPPVVVRGVSFSPNNPAATSVIRSLIAQRVPYEAVLIDQSVRSTGSSEAEIRRIFMQHSLLPKHAPINRQRASR